MRLTAVGSMYSSSRPSGRQLVRSGLRVAVRVPGRLIRSALSLDQLDRHVLALRHPLELRAQEEPLVRLGVVEVELLVPVALEGRLGVGLDRVDLRLRHVGLGLEAHLHREDELVAHVLDLERGGPSVHALAGDPLLLQVLLDLDRLARELRTRASVAAPPAIRSLTARLPIVRCSARTRAACDSCPRGGDASMAGTVAASSGSRSCSRPGALIAAGPPSPRAALRR